MPTSATGSWSKGARQTGFTLIELVVAVGIMALLVGLVVISVGDGGRERAIRDEGQRLTALLNIGREEAMLGRGTIGVAFTRHGYRFQQQQRVDEGTVEWRAIPDDSTLRARSLEAEDLELELTVEGRRVALETKPEHPAPNVFLEPEGTMTPFTLSLIDSTQPERGVVLEGAMDGTVELHSLEQRGAP